jgi:precorrin-2 dehydrogenase/sirohydrochlorin ferrochelatase
LLAREHAPEAHKQLFERLIDGGLLAMVKVGDRNGMEALLKSVLGDDVDHRRLLSGIQR